MLNDASPMTYDLKAPMGIITASAIDITAIRRGLLRLNTLITKRMLADSTGINGIADSYMN